MDRLDTDGLDLHTQVLEEINCFQATRIHYVEQLGNNVLASISHDQENIALLYMYAKQVYTLHLSGRPTTLNLIACFCILYF